MVKVKKIAILCSILGVLLGGGYFLLPSGQNASKSSQSKLSHLENLKSEVKDGLKKTGMDKVTNYVISRAESVWSKDPFADKGGAPSSSPAPTASGETGGAVSDNKPARIRPVFIYSGYMEVGNKRLAIVNGLEYEEKEELEIKGYYVDTIEQNWVIIEDRQNHEKITVFFGNP
jgi:hypothetical protein